MHIEGQIYVAGEIWYVEDTQAGVRSRGRLSASKQYTI